MNLLLDTHVLLWWLNGHPSLSRKSQAAIADGKNLVFVSAVVVWEIRIKAVLGKLEIPRNFKKALETQPFEMMDITLEHAHAVADLPAHHRDPFDRMLVAQAKVEGFTLVTHDVRLKKYRVSIMEA
ncbi:MAG: type II toxin-antitoxin system VapC family toxin [Deltaproteobacteria bacterium]|nr:type II toxin-antitoxin system VapC family toxin [Deltaproteobacteria bacterium]MBW2047407.1 type II toxin-antitoxin system VapC family toxin [Deltaproteobacteria bacterium]MBW2110425.1 type II toxin-antitoxin system VapC family toxin [Deltaproteobacteria bacterium]